MITTGIEPLHLKSSQELARTTNRLLHIIHASQLISLKMSLCLNTSRLSEFLCTELSGTIRLRGQCSKAGRVFAGVPTTLGTWFGFLTCSKCVQNRLRAFGCQVLIKVIIDCHHWSITTSSLTFNFYDREFAVLRGLANLDPAKVITNSLDNIGRAAKHARSCSADLDEVLANGFPVEHGIESSHFIDTHWRHFKELGDVVHNADACPSLVLPLAEIEEWDDCGFLVLGRITRDDILGPFQVFRCEFKWNFGVVVIRVTMHK